MSFTLGGAVTLRNPKLGNSRDLDESALVRETRSHILKVFKDTDWPSYEILNWEFEAICGTERDAFVAFLEANVAEEITIVDHNGDSHTGVIMTPIIEIITQQDDTFYNVNISFRSIARALRRSLQC